MQAGDYRNGGLFEGGMLKGAAVSLVVHALAFMLAFAAYRLVPPRKDIPRLCNVRLITLHETASKGGGGTTDQEDGAPKPEPEAVKNTEKIEAVEETAPTAPPPKAITKPEETPKPKPKAVPTPARRQRPARVETPSTAVRELETEEKNTPESPLPDQGTLPGSGSGNAGGSSGAASGTGAGVGHGPIDAAFGSGDGPRFAKKAPLKYPMLARELGKQGTVLLRITIDEKGRPVDVELVKRAGAGFDDEAVRAVRDSTFHPAMRNGRPVSCRVNLPVRFVLKDTDE